ncbi:gliding motility protein MglA [Minicystis rosea]|nr:gliding motility protein MglA [Minicystis rosea]
MSYFNAFSRELFCKIVYYGPGLCGKTTNVERLHERAPPAVRGNLVSLKTESERTLFFDFLPLDLGKVRDFAVRLQLYTVPGQVFYRASRRLILRGADAVVFVADSQSARLDANLEAMMDLRENLAELRTPLEALPCVLQYNKRDLDDIEPITRLRALLNPMGAPEVESDAARGVGVVETLRTAARLALRRLSA